MPSARHATPIGTSQLDWKTPVNYATGFCTNADSLPAAGDYAHFVTKPGSFENGIFWVEPTEGANQIILSYFGATAANQTFTADIFGVRRLGGTRSNVGEFVEYTGHRFGRHTVTLGAASIHASSRILPTSGLWADIITLTTDEIREGWEVFASAADGNALVMGDMVGCHALIVVLSLNGGTATGAGFMWAEV